MFSVPAEEQPSAPSSALPSEQQVQPLIPSVAPQKHWGGWAGLLGARRVPTSALHKCLLLLRSWEENKTRYSSGWTLALQCCIAVVIHHESIILRSNKGRFKEVKKSYKMYREFKAF